MEHLPILRSTSGSHGWPTDSAAELGDCMCIEQDLASGTQVVPTFHDAVWQQQLFEQIQNSSKQVNASTCDSDRCCLQSGDNTGTHLHVSRKAICQPKQQLHVSTSMESRCLSFRDHGCC